LAELVSYWGTYDIGVAMSIPVRAPRQWTFVSSHALALLHVSRAPSSSAREVADAIGVAQRQAQRLLADLVEEGYVRKTREGRRNRYELVEGTTLRHPLIDDVEVRALLGCLGGKRG
jgi:DNA-binding MarR family transcriptional regulator